MHVKSYILESLASLGMHKSMTHSNLQAVVCGRYMGSGQILDEAVETLHMLGLIKVHTDKDEGESIYEITQSGQKIADSLC